MNSETNTNEMLQGKRPDTRDYTAINIGAGDTPSSQSNSTLNNILTTISPWRGSPGQRKTKQIAYIALLVVSIIVFLILYRTPGGSTSVNGGLTNVPIVQDPNRFEYPLLAVVDRDSYSYDKENKVWRSLLFKGLLKRELDGKYTVAWDTKSHELKGKLAEQTRGLELSELKRFNGKLYSFDDRTGIVYEVIPKTDSGDYTVIGRYILPDGDGSSSKGFKCEWATVKDGKLWVGSIGKEWTTGTGDIIGKDPMWVKTIDGSGRVEHVNFIANYEALRNAVGAKYPGYMVHEAAEWSEFHKRWFFLPRRVSKDKYDENEDVKRGSNIILSASEDFTHITYKKIGTVTPTRGFSTMKFIPGRPNEIVAIKSEEEGESMKSYLTVFNLDGQVLLEETLIANEKVEGLEIA
jgi:soluble calcium-activated nucleotidase 1